MKKLILAVLGCSVIAMTGMAQAQPPAAKKKTDATVKTMKPPAAPAAQTKVAVGQKTNPAPAVKPSAKPAPPAVAKANTPAATKKDGSPDMRYKENKNAAAKKDVHLKKDGSKDMRYKENKKHHS